jgi:hypothetical protein
MTISTRQANGSSFDYKLVMHGRELDAGEVKELKQALAGHPDDLRIRLLLLGYYRRNTKSVSYFNQLIWLIDNHPRHDIHKLVASGKNHSEFLKAKRHWLRLVRSNPDDTVILRNAAHFCRNLNPESSMKFLKQALEVNGAKEEVALDLANVYRSIAGQYSPRKNRILARKAVEQLKVAVDFYALPTQEHTYLFQYFEMVMSDFAETALEFELFEEANDLGHILLNKKSLDSGRLSAEFLSKFTAENRRSVNLGYSILGRTALRSGNIAEAKKHLMHMTTVSVEWFSDWQLANELLQSGETSIVSQYIEHCRQGWEQMANDFEDGLPNKTGYLPGSKDDAVAWAAKLSSWLDEIARGCKPQLQP